MKRFLFGSDRTQSGLKHLVGLSCFSFLTVGLGYYSIVTYPISYSTFHSADMALGQDQGVSQAEADRVKQQYADFTKEWKTKGKDAQRKVWNDFKLFKQQQANMSVQDMQAFDHEANSVIKELDKV